MRNALNEIEDLGKMSFPGQNVAVNLYRILLNDLHVRSRGFRPSFEEFRQYFGWIKFGFEYGLKKWGPNCIPRTVKFVPKPDEDHIFYDEADNSIEFSYTNIAGYCRDALGVFVFSNWFVGQVLSPKNATKLTAVEICYYCYQSRIRRVCVQEFVQNFLARERIRDIISAAAEDFQIRYYDFFPGEFD